MSKHDLNDRYVSEGRNYVRKFCIWERQFKKYQSNTPLNWKCIPAKKGNAPSLPERQGVYAFVVKSQIANLSWSGYILYVGMTEKQTFSERFAQYFAETKRAKPRYWIKEMFQLWKKHLFYYYAETSVGDAKKIEDDLLEALLPPNNEKFPGTIGKVKKEIYSR